jgi:fumarylacetoacetase
MTGLALSETHDPKRRSWVSSANEAGADFPIQNLPFGIFRRRGSKERPRAGIAIGDSILDLYLVSQHLDGAARTAAEACGSITLSDLAASGADARSALRHAVSALLDERNAGQKSIVQQFLVPQADAELFLPFKIEAFTDFFASIFHATNAGRIFRPNQPLLPNYKFVPVAYNGRASTFRVSGAPVQRPQGQIKSANADVPERLPTRGLDYEAELGFYIGRGSDIGEPVGVDRANGHIFGCCLLNDWSARDIQAWEYQPLGPFLAKSFASTVSPWVITEEALRPYRTPAFVRPEGDPQILAYLSDPVDQATGGIDIKMTVYLRSAEMFRRGMKPVQLSHCSSSALYWTVGQMIAHQTSNGCNLQIGDLIGSGTISGETEGSFGSLLEITRRGEMPLQLPTGEMRAFLEDGDEVTISGFCERPGYARIGFGTCAGTVLPARSSE